jgi:hypothetical protein
MRPHRARVSFSSTEHSRSGRRRIFVRGGVSAEIGPCVGSTQCIRTDAKRPPAVPPGALRRPYIQPTELATAGPGPSASPGGAPTGTAGTACRATGPATGVKLRRHGGFIAGGASRAARVPRGRGCPAVAVLRPSAAAGRRGRSGIALVIRGYRGRSSHRGPHHQGCGNSKRAQCLRQGEPPIKVQTNPERVASATDPSPHPAVTGENVIAVV